VFADTGHEHPATYEYVQYLQEKIGIPIKWIRADFSDRIAAKRKYVAEKWPEKGVRQSVIENALSVLYPTGNPFLDLCLWKGRFPSTRVRFCTEELKRNPIIEQVFMPLMDSDETGLILSWQGVRADESPARRHLPECDEVGGGLFNYRPILKWPVSAVFEAHRYAGIKPNPLYLQGAGRVGCMPCINCGKDELRHIALRWPEEIERVREWERLVSLASKRQSGTFFCAVDDPTYDESDQITHENYGIERRVEWAMTSRGGRQFDLLAKLEINECSSSYGLCES
jgi:3'-phosphoadenosine 5'-phosphosulfate sulfotransferase (PAPS reductase)/FAD synthetase